jgi:protein-tyrosine phosphatase
MIKILFVCHGNICRSPFAEFVMKDLVKNEGLADEFFIRSAATSTEEIGNGVYPPVRKLLEVRGISCSEKRASQVRKCDYENYDYIVCMDKNNLRNISRIVGADTENKISLLLDFTDTPRDVADPWYTGDFEATQSDIDKGCLALLEYIKKHNSI